MMMQNDGPVQVIGAGSVGCFLAAALKKSGVDVVLVGKPDITKTLVRLEWIQAGQSSFIEVPLIGIHEVLRSKQIWITTKAQSVGQVMDQIKTVIGADTFLAFFQNGLGVLDDLELVLPPNWVRAVCWFGVRKQVISRDHFQIHVAGIDSVEWGGPGANSPDLVRVFEDLLRRAKIPTLQLASADQVEWRKALWNLSSNALCAVAGAPNGDAEADPRLRPIAEAIYREAARVAEKRGVALPADIHERVFLGMKKTATNLNSMLMDLRAGRPTELAWLNEKVVDWGMAMGLPVATNQLICQLIRYLESKNLNSPSKQS